MTTTHAVTTRQLKSDAIITTALARAIRATTTGRSFRAGLAVRIMCATLLSQRLLRDAAALRSLALPAVATEGSAHLGRKVVKAERA